jgi:ADP-ribosyl-[dinitrogen reductase] hydrolase
MSNVLLGTCIGDALGVHFEKKLSNYQPLIDWDGSTFLGSEHHGLKPGQYSDDGQFSIEIASSLIENHGFNPDDLAKRYVQLFESNKIRGYGRTTLLAIQNLQSGKHWSESGIKGSYGNGTAMRSAPFGIYFRNDLYSLVNICKIDSAITHASDEAEAGSIAIALAAAYAVNNDMKNLIEKICDQIPNSKVKNIIYTLDTLVSSKDITPEQALRVIGTKADVRETVPAAIYCFLKLTNYHDAVITAIKAGNDTDTTAAIVGALFGAKNGMKNIPQKLICDVENGEMLVKLDSQLYNRSDKSFFPRH